MGKKQRHVLITISGLVLALCATLAAAPLSAIQPTGSGSELADREFRDPALVLSPTSLPLDDSGLKSADHSEWRGFFVRHGGPFPVRIDPRSGRATTVMTSIPLIPGSGRGNNLTHQSLADRIGRPVGRVDEGVASLTISSFLKQSRGVLDIEVEQFGEILATPTSDDLWQIHIPRQIDGVPVRGSRLAATISHGNLILLGTEVWGDAKLDVAPSLSPEEALKAGFEYAGGRRGEDVVQNDPALEIVPLKISTAGSAGPYAGPVGKGYEYRLVWAFTFKRGVSLGLWEVLVDAGTGEVIAFQDIFHYGEPRNLVGGVYAETNTGVCPTDEHDLVDFNRCGEMQQSYPMPGVHMLTNPAQWTDGAGGWDYLGSEALTRLESVYATIRDNCNFIRERTENGELDLGGQNGQHDCDGLPDPDQGTTAAARTASHELGRLSEIARGWLVYDWVGTLGVNVNIETSIWGPLCNAWYDPSDHSLNFLDQFAGCGNGAELVGVIDHEWGHALDLHDANQQASVSSEAYADIVAAYRTHDSCIGYGWLYSNTCGGQEPPPGEQVLPCDLGCGEAPDGTGPLGHEVPSHCLTECTGIRDIDYEKHAHGTPDTPQNYVCESCNYGNGLCGRDVWCSSTPATQAAWDLVDRDLQQAPFFYDTNEAFIIGNRLLYQGSGNIVEWYACDCEQDVSHGCNAFSAYMQWLAADDDNGDLSDGTPHMQAIFNAFDRHNIACNEAPLPSEPINGGCIHGPYDAPEVTLTPADRSINVSWTEVQPAAQYWVLRSEGLAACENGKALIAETDLEGFEYTDTEVLPGHPYCYSVMPAHKKDACMGRASVCACTTPRTCESPSVQPLLDEDFKHGIPGDWSVIDGGTGGGDASAWVDSDPCRIRPDDPFNRKFAVVDSACAGPGAVQDEQLITPLIDLDGCQQAALEFSNQMSWSSSGGHEIADVDVSTDGGTSWTNVMRIENRDLDAEVPGTRSIDLTPQIAGAPSATVRFHYYQGAGDGHWAVDNVRVDCTCTPDP